MEITDFYANILGIDSSWIVKRVVLAGEAAKVEVFLEYSGSALHPCPLCGRGFTACESSPQQTWRHLDTCGKTTCLHAGLPIIDCPAHGRQQCNPPWGDRMSSLTSAFAHHLAGLAAEVGNLKQAARAFGIEQAHLSHFKRNIPGTGKTDTRSSGLHPGTVPVPPGPKARQFSLFEQNDMSFANRGIQAYRSMELAKALELFEKHRRLYPRGYDVSSRAAAAEFLVREMETVPSDVAERPGFLCRLWNSFEEYVERAHPGREATLFEVQPAFFARIVKLFEQYGPALPLSFPGGIPTGYIFLQAGLYDEAVKNLQRRILESPDDASLYGYLGDAYLLRHETQPARHCYREACLIDPAGMDWRRLRDPDLKELREDLRLEYGSDAQLILAWLPSHARVNGLFEPKAVRVNDGLKELVDDYLAAEKEYLAHGSPFAAARLFFRGLILCENRENLRFIKKIDTVRVRRMMKKANPHLFEDFLEGLQEGKGRSRE